MFVVHFKSESGDNYYSAFERKPDDYELKVWIIYHWPESIEDGVCYIHVNSVTECEFYDVDEGDLDLRELPYPDKVEWM